MSETWAIAFAIVGVAWSVAWQSVNEERARNERRRIEMEATRNE